MSELNARLGALSRATPRDPLLSMRVSLPELQSFFGVDRDAADHPTLRAAGFIGPDGTPTPAGDWLRNVTSGDEAVALTLRWQSKETSAELQMWLDTDLALLVDLRATHGEQAPDVLLGYASFLDLPSVMARWLGLGPASLTPVDAVDIDSARLTALVEQQAPAGMGSLSAGDVPLVDFAFDGEHYRIIVDNAEAPDMDVHGRETGDVTAPRASGVRLEAITSWNLLLLLTAAATSPPPTLEA